MSTPDAHNDPPGGSPSDYSSYGPRGAESGPPRDDGPSEGGPSEGGPSEGGPSEGGPSEGGPSDGAGPPPEGNASAAAEHPRRRRFARYGTYALYGLGGLLGTVVLAAALVLGVLQTDWGARKAKGLILSQVNPVGEAELRVGRIDGNWLTRLTFYDVTLVRPPLPSDEVPTSTVPADSVRMAHVDSLTVRFRLLPLLRKHVHLRRVDLSGARINMAQQSDGTWDLVEPFTPEPPVEPNPPPWHVTLDAASLQNVSASARFYAPGRDSTLQVHNLNTHIQHLVAGVNVDLGIDVQSLDARFTPPGQRLQRRLALSGALTEGRRLTLRTLNLNSPYSNLAGRGTLLLPGEDQDRIENIDFRLEARPLDFRDLAGFVPGIDPSRSVRFTLTAQGSSRRLQANLDASFSDGGTLAVNGTIAPGTGGPRIYDVQGTVRRLDPNVLAGDRGAPPQSQVSADFSVSLRGSEMDRLDGTLRAEVFDSRYGDYAFERSQLVAHFRNGTATVDLQAGLRGATLAATGTVRPFAQPLAYDLDAQFSNVDIGRLTGNPNQQSNLSGQISFEGYGTNPQEANVTAMVSLAPSSINQYRLQESRLTGRLIDGELSFQTQLNAPQGGLVARGDIWFEDPLRYRISEGQLQAVDVAALTGDTTRSRISGTFRLSGRGTTPQTARIDVADLRLRDSYYGPYDINTTNLSAVVRDGRVDVRGQAQLRGGRFDLVATLRPFDGLPSYNVQKASFSNVDIGQLGQYAGAEIQNSSDLNGTITLSGRGFQPEVMYLTADARLSDSRLNRQPIDEAVADLTLQDGRLSYAARLDVPEGQTRLIGSLRPFSETPTFEVREGTFNNLNVGALAGIEGLETSLQGQLRLKGRGRNAEALDLNLRLDSLGGSTINDERLTDGAVTIQMKEGIAQLNGTLDLTDGQVTLDGQANLAGETRTYQAEGTVVNLDVGALTGDSEADTHLTLDFDLQGEGTDPETMTLRGNVTARSTRMADIRLDQLALRFGLDDGLLRVDTLRLRSNVADASGAGRLALFGTGRQQTSDFNFAASIDSLGPLQPFLDGDQALNLQEGSIEGHLTSSLGQGLLLETNATLSGLVYQKWRVGSFDGIVTAQLKEGLSLDSLSLDALESAEAHGEVVHLSTPQGIAQRADFDAVYTGESVNFTADATVDQRRDVKVAGTLDLRPSRQGVRVNQLDLRLGSHRWQLLQEATITYGEEYRVSNLLLYSDDQQIAVDGVIDLDGQQNLVLTIENFQIGTVADLLDYQGLGGTLTGSLTLTGPARAPQMSGTLNADLQAYDETTGELRLALSYDNQRLNLDALLQNQDGGRLTAEGSLPLDLRLNTPEAQTLADSLLATRGATGTLPANIVEVSSPDTVGADEVALNVKADSFDVDWVRPFLNPEQIDRLNGNLTGNVDIGGTLKTPQMNGRAALANGEVGLPVLGLAYKDIRARAEFNGEQARLLEARLHSGDGQLTARGTVNLQNLTLGQYDLSLQASDFRAVSTSAYRAIVDSDLSLKGTTERPVLTGDVTVESADINLDELGTGAQVEEVNLTPEDLQTLEERFGLRVGKADTTQNELYEALAMEVNLRVENDTWLRSSGNPELDIQFDGSLDVQKNAFEDLQLFGSIEVIPERSRIVQFGKRFTLTDGILNFNGNPADPVLDISAEYNVAARRSRGNEVTITLNVDGRLDDLDFNLGSEPQMENTDILSYIATGRPANESFFGGGSGGGESLAAGLALSQVNSLVENIAGSELGLDVITLEQDPYRGTVLTAGKYVRIAGVARPLYVAVSQPVAFNGTSGAENVANEPDDTQITLEYEFLDGLLVRLLRRNYIRLNLLFEYAY